MKASAGRFSTRASEGRDGKSGAPTLSNRAPEPEPIPEITREEAKQIFERVKREMDSRGGKPRI
jgi:hypothetical protein